MTAPRPTGSYLEIGGQYALANAIINLSGNNIGNSTAYGTAPLLFAAGTNNVSIGGLTGIGNIVLSDRAGTPAAVALTVGGGSTNPSTAYSGNLFGLGSLIKAGSGSLTLNSGGSTFTGNVTVNGGTLVVNTQASGTGNSSALGNLNAAARTSS